jgi:hypothetical protein
MTEEDLLQEWCDYQGILEIVGGKSRVPYSLSSYIVNSVLSVINDVFGQGFDINSSAVKFEASCNEGNVTASLKDISSGNTISYMSKILGEEGNEGLKGLVRSVTFLFMNEIELSVVVGGREWSRNTCLLSSYGEVRGDRTCLVIKG